MSTGSPTPAPAILGHCQQVYEAMKARASKDASGQLYWEGALTRLVADCGLSNPYYTSVTQSLKAMDCIRQGRRGGGGMGSIWYLLQEPTTELYNALGPSKGRTQGAAALRQTEGEQASRALHMRISKLEQQVAVLEAKLA